MSQNSELLFTLRTKCTVTTSLIINYKLGHFNVSRFGQLSGMVFGINFEIISLDNGLKLNILTVMNLKSDYIA